MRHVVQLARHLSFALALTLAFTWMAAAQDSRPPAAPSGQQPAATPSGAPTPASALAQTLGPSGRLSYHTHTGKVRFVGADPSRPIPRAAGLATDADPEQAARAFLAAYGPAFGLADQGRELTLLRRRQADRGRAFVRFQQVHQGVPVLGGELIVQLDAARNVVSASGEISPSPQVGVVPAVSADVARQRAIEAIARDHNLDPSALAVSPPELRIYDPALLGAPGPQSPRLVWQTEVTSVDLLPIRELVLVDAQLGVIALHFNQVDTALYRQTYDAQSSSTLPGVLRRSEGQGPIGDTDVDSAHDYAGDTYNFYYANHGRDGIDGAGMTITSSVRYCSPLYPCPYQNAFWNGQQMVYGQGFASADDVVGHELTHGVTQYESHLFYYMQSGAINESFSDIWGEFVDLTNGHGNDVPDVRWLLGEDLPVGAGRSMSNPPIYGQPDTMTSTYYYCGSSDGGGVHTNSGVGNKAAYLMVDGGTFNGKSVAGLGIAKVARIWYEVQTNLFTSAGDYQDLYDGLQQACTDLIGTGGITAADCQQVKNALDAVQMNQQPTLCATSHAPVCPAGQSSTDLFFDDLENPSAGRWISGALTGANAWYYPQNSHPYSFDATYATSGRYNLWGYDQPSTADYFTRMTSDVVLPALSTPYLRFNHAYSFDSYGSSRYDGGVLEYSTNGGATWTDAGPLITDNGYNGTISAAWGNPLGGRQAFTARSNGYISSRVSLSSLAGQSVRFRFRIGTDTGGDDYGWFVDDVRVYTCATAPTPTVTPTLTATPTPTVTPTRTPPPSASRLYLPLLCRN